MTIPNPRSRMVSVRLSEEEFLGLRRVCSVSGARSISEVAREAMRAVLSAANRDDLLGRHLDEFRAEIKSLEKKVEQLEAKIATSRADGSQ